MQDHQGLLRFYYLRLRGMLGLFVKEFLQAVFIFKFK